MLKSYCELLVLYSDKIAINEYVSDMFLQDSLAFFSYKQ